MKKNRMLKIASAMIMLCLITTCAIGTTFAKYTTASSAADTARVAKWGVEVSASGTMFGKAYHNTIVEDGDASATVQSNGWATYSDKVVAPGTENTTGIQIKLKGKPEVDFNFDAQITDAAEDVYLAKGNYGVMVKAHGVNAATNFAAEKIYYFDTIETKYKAANLTYYLANTDADYYKLTDEVNVTVEKYHPIVWTGKIVATDTVGVGSGTQPFDTLADAVANLVDGINALPTYQANANVDLVYTLTWAWAFDGGHDKEDTILGNIMAMEQDVNANDVVVLQDDGTYTVVADVTNYSLNVGCGFRVTATQVD